MKTKITVTALLLLMMSGASHGAQPYKVPAKYEALFERIESKAEFMLEIRHAETDEEFPVNEHRELTLPEGFEDLEDGPTVTVSREASGIASIEGVTLAWELTPSEYEDRPHKVEMVLMEKTRTGGNSAFRGVSILATNTWKQVLKFQRSQEDKKKYVYLMLRLRDLSPDETEDKSEKKEKES